jgi:hypothetical protein
MYALFDDAGKFHAGRVMSEADSSVQVELDSGKRVKVKSANVMLRFEKPAPAEFMAQAQARAAGTAAAGATAVFRGGSVFAAGCALPAWAGSPADTAVTGPAVEALAERARGTAGAAVGLAVGAARPGPEGRFVVDIAIADAAGVERVEHMLGGGPTLALSRASKTAIDLVRRRLAERAR